MSRINWKNVFMVAFAVVIVTSILSSKIISATNKNEVIEVLAGGKYAVKPNNETPSGFSDVARREFFVNERTCLGIIVYACNNMTQTGFISDLDGKLKEAFLYDQESGRLKYYYPDSEPWNDLSEKYKSVKAEISK